ncbi:hypothetical protein FISHEDRAFT_56151 [Fistulina hepatica ATCC 64428]|uniref:DUF6697 domain-containing protein n=1 Tax=Fistulina hepatica ATCC 64428 TaxID=1128425 RepID=A0A0D7AJY8_9AGAR|nr:hypothetical protein FISHEDRAFT_56151 [Fistulina hepatica ATCC 64428]
MSVAVKKEAADTSELLHNSVAPILSTRTKREYRDVALQDDPNELPDTKTVKTEDEASISKKQTKRCRLTFDGVEVPDLALALEQRRRRHEDLKIIRKYDDNPKIKKKKNEEDLRLSPEILRSRLHAANISLTEFPIENMEKDVLDAAFDRRMISRIYGGSPEQTFPRPSAAKLAEHGLDDFFCPSLMINPDAPKLPGFPGLFFRPWRRMPLRLLPAMRVIVRLGPNQWQYMGQYEVRPAESLTVAEWRQQKTSVQDAWAHQILTKNWGKNISIRVHLRQVLGRQPTEEEEGEIEVKTGQKLGVGKREIVEAFLSGEEVMCVWTMKCVGYDAAFQRRLFDEAATWTATAHRAQTRKKSTKNSRSGNDSIRSTLKSESAVKEEGL